LSIDQYVLALAAGVAELGDQETRVITVALASGTIGAESTAYEIRAVTGLANATSSNLESLFREAIGCANSTDAARWLLIGLLQRPKTPAVAPMLVWTAPGGAAAVRNIESVITQLIQGAQRSITLVGYAVTQAADPLLNDLADAVRRGVDVSLVVDRLKDRVPQLFRGWPRDVQRPALWTREADLRDEMSALHAKVLITDDRYLLVSSANLTYHGLRGNLEIGVLLQGDVALEMKALLNQWIRDRLITSVQPAGPGVAPGQST
jgi:phosphatidylserine/phosphatidylglycerophosphate/cardiolipin synthase-like enzyme